MKFKRSKNINKYNNTTPTCREIRSVMHLPRGGKPVAADEEECLREFRDSELGKDSVSEAVYLLPLVLAWDKFYKSIFTT